jgi:hypothetical protein
MALRRRHFVIDILISTDDVYEVLSASKAYRFSLVIRAGQGSVNLRGIDAAEVLVTNDKDRQHTQSHTRQVLRWDPAPPLRPMATGEKKV